MSSGDDIVARDLLVECACGFIGDVVIEWFGILRSIEYCWRAGG